MVFSAKGVLLVVFTDVAGAQSQSPMSFLPECDFSASGAHSHMSGNAVSQLGPMPRCE